MGRQPVLRQNAGDNVVMDAELAGDRAAPPLLDMVVAQDLGVEFGGYDHGRPSRRAKPDGSAAAQGVSSHEWRTLTATPLTAAPERGVVADCGDRRARRSRRSRVRRRFFLHRRQAFRKTTMGGRGG